MMLFVFSTVWLAIFGGSFGATGDWNGYLNQRDPYDDIRRPGRGRTPPVIATFRFERLEGRGRHRERGRNSGWNVSGCYCPGTNQYCDCSNASTRVKMTVKAKKPLVKVKTKKVIKYRAKSKSKDGGVKTKPLSIRSGCFCDSKGCRGSTCDELNGCVCSEKNGKCWGNNCPSDRSNQESDIVGGNNWQQAGNGDVVGGNVIPMMGSIDLGDNFSLMDPLLQGSNQNQKRTRVDGCLCSSTGCLGSGCPQMNGCFCGDDQCWGKHCSFGEQSADTIFKRKKFGGGFGLSLGDEFDQRQLFDGKINMVKEKFENLIGGKKNMMNTMGNKFGDLVNAKVTMVGDKFNGISGVKANMMNNMGNQLEDLTNSKVTMIKGKLNSLTDFKPNMMNNMGDQFNDIVGGKLNSFGGGNNMLMNNMVSSEPGSLVNAKVVMVGDKLTGLDGIKANMMNNIGEVGGKLGELVNGKVEMINGKLNAISEGKTKLMDSLGGKLTTLMAARPVTNLGEMMSGKLKNVENMMASKPMTNGGSKLETLLGNKVNMITGSVNNLVNTNSQGMNNLVGQVIPVVKSYPIDSIVGVPMSHTRGTKIQSIQRMPLDSVIGRHVQRLQGQKVSTANGMPVNSANGVTINSIRGVPAVAMSGPHVQPTAIIRANSQGFMPAVTVRTIGTPHHSSSSINARTVSAETIAKGQEEEGDAVTGTMLDNGWT